MLENNFGPPRKGLPALEWYTMNQFSIIVREPFSEDSPIELHDLKDQELESIPILNQIRYTMQLINEAGEMDLTRKGNLKRKVVRDIYSQNFFKDTLDLPIEPDDIYRQADCVTVELTKILLDISNLTKTRNNKYSLTKKGEDFLNKTNQLLKYFFKQYCNKFNMGYYDGCIEEIGNLGVGYSLILLSKYGDKSRRAKFYADKYFKAFPDILEKVEPKIGNKKEEGTRTYIYRIFKNFLNFFGLINITQENNVREKYIQKTDLYNKFITCELPQE